MRNLRVLWVIMLVLLPSSSKGQQETQASRGAKLAALTGGLLAVGAALRYWVRRSPQLSRVLLSALRDRNSEVVRPLVALGVRINRSDINTPDAVGRTPLHYAADQGYNAIVRNLIAAGADVNAADGIGMTPLHYAIRQGYNAIVRDLIGAGADVNAANVEGNTPLYYAVRNTTEPDDKIENIIKILLDHGATGEDRATLSADQKSSLDRVMSRIQKRIEQVVYEVQPTAPKEMAEMISKFAY